MKTYETPKMNIREYGFESVVTDSGMTQAGKNALNSLTTTGNVSSNNVATFSFNLTL